jgi:hypothetical protein
VIGGAGSPARFADVNSPQSIPGHPGEGRQSDGLMVHADTFLGRNLMRLKQSVFVSILAAAALVVVSLFAPSFGVAQDGKVKTAMELLRSMADKLGPPKIEGWILLPGNSCPQFTSAQPR